MTKKSTQKTSPLSPNFEISISKETLNTLQPARFEGEIIVVDRQEDVATAIAELRKGELIGFDTETKPSFKKGQNNYPALLQLSSNARCYLFRLCKTGVTPEIRQFLEDVDITKIGLSIKDDFHNLNRMCKVEPQGFVELQNYVKEFGITDASLTKIHAILFDRKISKGQQLSNWEAPSLTTKQQQYAALDAYACVEIYKHLKAGKFDPATSPYIKKEEENS